MKPIGTFTVAIFEAEEGKGRPTAIVYQESEGADGVAAIRDFATAFASGHGSCVIINAKSGLFVVSEDAAATKDNPGTCGRTGCVLGVGHSAPHADQGGDIIETDAERDMREAQELRTARLPADVGVSG